MDSKEGSAPQAPPSYDDSVESYPHPPQQQQHGGPGGYPQQYPGFPHQLGYPPQPTGGYPSQVAGGYTQQGEQYPPPQPGCYPPPQSGGYHPQPAGGYQPPAAGGYPPRPQGGYPPQPQGGYPPQPAGDYPTRPAGGYPPRPAGGYPPQQYAPAGATTHKPVNVVVAAPADPINRGGLGAEYEDKLRSTTILSGIACLCFCCPIGIVAFICVQSSKTAAAEGLRDMAYQRLGRARQLAFTAIALGIILYIFAGFRNFLFAGLY